MMQHPSSLDPVLNALNTELMNKAWCLFFRILPKMHGARVGQGCGVRYRASPTCKLQADSESDLNIQLIASAAKVCLINQNFS